MTTIVTLNELKDWLYLPRTADEVRDTKLTSLLTAACEQVGDATGLTLVGDTLSTAPEQIKTAIKFRVASWFENPLPDAEQEASAQKVVDALIAKFRVFHYPGEEDAEPSA